MNELIRVVGICNGLVFLAVADDTLTLANTFMIFNPSMRKLVTLPKPTIGRYYTCIGFGFDAVTNDYKVVRFITDRPNTFYEVYSLAGGSWSNPRSLDHVCEVMDPLKSQAFVNGAIHWGAWRRLTNSSYEYIILAFDVGSDLFHRIMVQKSFSNSWTAQLSVSGDGKSIALFQPCFISIGEPCLDIWVMKECGMEESWTKLTVSPLGPQRGVRYRPLCFRKSGGIVLVPTDSSDGNDRYELVCLDYYAESYVESIVLLDKTNAVSY